MNQTFTKISRRQLFQMAATGAGSFLVLSLLPKTAAAAPGASLKSTISANHGHLFAAKLEEVLNSGNKTYNIKGSASHGHNIDITEQIIATLKQTKVVEIESSESFAHAHVLRLQIV